MTVTLHAAAVAPLPPDLLARWQEVPAAVAADVLAARGATGGIDPAIRPLLPPGVQPRLFGRAVTALCAPPDFGAVLHALDRVGPGDVRVIAAGGDGGTAMIGEILGGHLRRRGAAGLACDGAVRDVAAFADWGDFPVFCRSVTPQGPAGVSEGEVNAPVAFGGVHLAPGDLLIGDADGLVALSPALAADAIGDAEAKLALEARWIAELGQDRPVAEVFGLEAPDPA